MVLYIILRQYILISITIFIPKAQSQCEFLENIVSIDNSLNSSNYSVGYKLQESAFKERISIGFGLWIKYQPLKYYGKQFDRSHPPPRDFYENKTYLERKKEQFVFSMMQKALINSQLILAFRYNEKSKLFEYLIYTDFLTTSETIIQNIEPSEIEDKWYIFYFYSDIKEKITKIGFYNQQQKNWSTHIIQDVPQITQEIEIHIGGGNRIEKYQKKYLLFKKFYGTLTTAFTTKQYNLINNYLGNCQDRLKYNIECYHQYASVGHSSDHLDGNNYIHITDSKVYTQSFIINGWVKLDPLSEQQRETLIMRVTLNQNYDDDQNIGDRFIYLQYYQNQIPELNGFKIQTQGYEIPILYPYKTQISDTIENYDEAYQKLFIKWHFIQFEKGTSKNKGDPLFTLQFSNYKSQEFSWKKHFNYFSQPTLYFNFGGDKFTKNNIKGYLQYFYFQEICGSRSTPFNINRCRFNCETCDGPTENSCLSCKPNSDRYYEDQTQSCQCSDNFYDDFERQCIDMFDFGLTPASSYNKISSGKYNQCQYGYILIQNSCFQCPYYELVESKLQIKCADCYINYKQFVKTLTCTFDYISYQYQIDFAYQQYNRSLDEIEIFKIDFIQQKLIKLESKFKKKSIKYQNGQTFKNEECITIVECNNFEIVNEIPLNCLSCNQGFYLNNNQCIQCGKFCQSCNSFGLCNFCIDSQQYYLTFDGINCNRCQIQYCKYCFQYYYQNDKMYSTLDIDFQLQKLQSNQIYEGCAQCNDSYFFNFQTNQCELKCQNLQNNNQKQQCLLQYQDCQFGVILTNSSIYCIQSSQYSQISILYQDCNQFKNCYYCQNSQVLNQIPKCIICKEGYYLEIENGKCQLCPNECTTCYQQNIQQQDYWKQQIYGFYQLLFNLDGQQQFEEYSMNYQQQQQIKCLRCIQGYVLYNNNCIKDCDSSCKQCIIEQGQSVCIQCGKKYRGYMRSKSDQGTCYDCPNGCSACIDRDLLEIQDYNPYFILTQDNIKQTRKCFEVFEDKENLNSLFVDQENLFVVQCIDKNYCTKEINYHLDVFCSSPISEVDLIYYNQTFIETLFRQQCFGFDCQDFESVTVEIFAKLSTQKINIYLNFIQNASESCIIENDYSINTTVQTRVFSVAEVNLYFVGSKVNTALSFKGTFHIHNFKSVTFQNLKLQFIESEENQDKLYQININSKYYFHALTFENCTFNGQANNQIQLLFQINQAYVLNIRNVNFIDFQILNTNMFSTSLIKHNTQILLIENLHIQNSIFTNTSFFYLIDSNSQEYLINISSLTIKNSKFISSSIIWIESNGLQDSTFFIYNFLIESSEFIISKLFRQFAISYVEIRESKILNSQFNQSNVFLISQDLHIAKLVLQSINNFNSSFIQNYNSQENKNLQLLNFTININDISITNLTTDKIQPIIQLTKAKTNLFFNLKLNKIQLANISVSSSSQIQQFQSYYLALIYIECDVILFQNIDMHNFLISKLTQLWSD